MKAASGVASTYILGPAAGQHCWETGRSVCSVRDVCTGTAVSTADLNLPVAYHVTETELHVVWCILHFECPHVTKVDRDHRECPQSSEAMILQEGSQK